MAPASIMKRRTAQVPSRCFQDPQLPEFLHGDGEVAPYWRSMTMQSWPSLRSVAQIASASTDAVNGPMRSR